MNPKNRLLYVVGPSGVGKDALINRLREIPSLNSKIYFVKRQVDRPIHASSPMDVFLSADDFVKALESQSMAMYWCANQHQYGVTVNEMKIALTHRLALINGSRAYSLEVKKMYPQVEVVHITASESIIKERLMNRNRENAAEIENRIHRSREFSQYSTHYAKDIFNDTNLDTALEQLRQYLEM